MNWIQKRNAEREARKKCDKVIVGVLGALLFSAILAIVIGLRWLVFAYVPCSFFPVAEAPVRCIVGGS
jgi:hypothetical protein